MEGLGVDARRRECLNDFIHAWLEFGDREGLLEIRQGRRILAHGLVVLVGTPLGIHRDLCSVEASMKPCQHEPLGMAHRIPGRSGKQLDQLLLSGWLDSEHVDEDDGLIVHGAVSETACDRRGICSEHVAPNE